MKKFEQVAGGGGAGLQVKKFEQVMGGGGLQVNKFEQVTGGERVSK